MTTNIPKFDASIPVTSDELQQAIAYHQADRLGEAETLYREILLVEPSNPDVLHNLGLLLLQRAEPALALPYLNAALEVQPQNPQCWLSYADCLLAAGMVDDARQVILAGRSSGLDGAAADLLEARITAAWLSWPDLASLQALAAMGRFEDLVEQALGQIQHFGEHIELMNLLAEGLIQLGRDADALPWLERVCTAAPTEKDVWTRWGLALNRVKEYEGAYRVLLKALALAPSDAATLTCLGQNLYDAGFAEEARIWLRRAVLEGVESWSAWLLLLDILVEMGLESEARETFASLMASQQPPPQEAAAGFLAVLESGLDVNLLRRPKKRLASGPGAEKRNEVMRLLAANRLDLLGTFAQALCEAFPLDSFGWKVLGVVLKVQKGDLGQALTAMQLAAAASPEDVEAHCNLSSLLSDLKRYAEAELAARRALLIDPEHANAYFNLGSALHALQCFAEAAEVLRRSLALNPNLHDARALMQFALHYREDCTPETVLHQAREYGRRVQVPGAKRYSTWKCDPRPSRLRVGFVSGDFRVHPVGFFSEGLFAAIDPALIDLVAYDTFDSPDALTERIRPYFSKWTILKGLSDIDAAQCIHDDGIHVLIDLSGFTAYHRLPVFARKPAPVQASWLGYFATTGLPQMDFLLADEMSLPTEHHSHCTEQVWLLPETRLCFTPPDMDLKVSPLPARTNGFITFGSFQAMAKINDSVLATWARVLSAVPTARLRIQNKHAGTAISSEVFSRRLLKAGIDPLRVDLFEQVARDVYLEAHSEVDILLDTFPYPGGTTTCEALWMGVPTLTLLGDSMMARQGGSLLMAAGLPDWVVSNTDDYVAKAVRFAEDVSGLAALRAGLRDQVIGSPLFDVPRFARNIERALWCMWTAKRKPSDSNVSAQRGKNRRR